MRKAAKAGNAAQPGMLLNRAYHKPIPHRINQPANRAARKPPDVLAIGLILASVLLARPLRAGPFQEAPPPNLAKLVAQRETETEKERSEYTYRQTVTIDELDNGGATRGTYREVRDIVFSPDHERSEQMIGHPVMALKNLILTEED